MLLIILGHFSHIIFSGVGKSKTINACAQWAERLLRRAGPYLPRVLILGPTGASAALIGN